MPLATIHLISLTRSTSIFSFLEALQSTSLQPLVVSKVIRWIITPTKIDAPTLLRPSKPWDLLLIVLGNDELSPSLKSQIECHWTTSAGIPSRLTKGFPSANDKLLHPSPSSVPALTGSLDNPRMGPSSQTLEMSSDLSKWINSFSQTHTGKAPLSMLNLLAFKPGMKPSYLQYGKAFAETIGARRGGNAKLVGNIVTQTPREQSGGVWDEFALASYPSILHFADMLSSEDYQSVNLKYRVPALEDTFILCTSEIEVEDLMRIGKRAMGKL
ncbi:uncharacterized protein Z518_04566 [Rhinocladiella mackenziei CBS 650.93]|uniref:DUF1330 domain-containing protein n=1 Tax=Rhinocladiella mackenziei CBS 650.93 TaxID=1442369 RepID=A0A0D2JBW7_9EURO|nr:uncharacterized protein Z518_04566 [Rhinocladiella mackenziei CBS 650.93]KIX06590.1 hypothetical protein Z518_04566 [Rhinocladiella mackenziei CBS 650.93]